MMSKKLYIVIYAASFGWSLLTMTALGASSIFDPAQSDLSFVYTSGFAVFAYLQFVVVHAIYNFLLLAQMWRAIQDGQTRVTVKKAIWLLFVPFFNVYWIFRAWSGFPAAYNRYVERYDLPVPPLERKVFAAYPLLLLAGVLFVPLFVLPFIFLAVIADVCGAVNRLETAVRTRRDELTTISLPAVKPAADGSWKIKV